MLCFSYVLLLAPFANLLLTAFSLAHHGLPKQFICKVTEKYAQYFHTLHSEKRSEDLSAVPDKKIGYGGTILSRSVSFYGVNTLAEWMDRENGLQKRLYVVILLFPWAAADNGTIFVVYSGNILQVDVVWPVR